MSNWTEEAILAKGLKLREPLRATPPVDAVTLDLPLPPSTNNLFVTIPKKGRVRSQDYCRWHKRAFDELVLQKAGRIKGRFSIVISVGRIKRRADVDNRSKAILDLLAGVVTDDDSYCERMSIGWSDDVAAERVTVTVRAA